MGTLTAKITKMPSKITKNLPMFCRNLGRVLIPALTTRSPPPLPPPQKKKLAALRLVFLCSRVGNKFGAQTAERHGGGYGRRHWIYMYILQYIYIVYVYTIYIYICVCVLLMFWHHRTQGKKCPEDGASGRPGATICSLQLSCRIWSWSLSAFDQGSKILKTWGLSVVFGV